MMNDTDGGDLETFPSCLEFRCPADEHLPACCDSQREAREFDEAQERLDRMDAARQLADDNAYDDWKDRQLLGWDR